MIVSSRDVQRDVAEHQQLTKQAHRRSRQAIFDQIHTLREARTSIRDIARETGFGPRSIRKWLKFSASGPPRRGAKALFTRLFPGLSVAPLGGRVRSRPNFA